MNFLIFAIFFVCASGQSTMWLDTSNVLGKNQLWDSRSIERVAMLRLGVANEMRRGELEVNVDPFRIARIAHTILVPHLSKIELSKLVENLDGTTVNINNDKGSEFYKQLSSKRRSKVKFFSSAKNCKVAQTLANDIECATESNAETKNTFFDAINAARAMMSRAIAQTKVAMCWSIIEQLPSDAHTREQVLSELRAMIEAEQAAGVAIGVLSRAAHKKRNEKRAILAAAEEGEPGVTASAFHLLLWNSLLWIILAYLGAYVLFSLDGETEKDALLYRNTTSTLFDHTLEFR